MKTGEGRTNAGAYVPAQGPTRFGGGRDVNLFQLGDFTLNSGVKSKWKLECDALTNDDWKALAEMVWQMVGPFSSVEGVPRGGLRLAESLQSYKSELDDMPHLIVDDVLTTGMSLERKKAEYLVQNPRLTVWGEEHTPGLVMGAVVFARGRCPAWVQPLFQMPEELWIRK